MASTVSNGNDRSEKWQRPFQMATTLNEREISITDLLSMYISISERVHYHLRTFSHAYNWLSESSVNLWGKQTWTLAHLAAILVK